MASRTSSAYYEKLRIERNSGWMVDDSGSVHILLPDGQEALIDECDRELAAQFTWHSFPCPKTTYAVAMVPAELLGAVGVSQIFLHRLIAKCPKDWVVDHRDFNGLNCRKENLRIATNTQNAAYARYPRSMSPYRGIFKVPSGNWRSQIRINRKMEYLGTFPSPEDAARAYNSAALKQYGEFAILNDVPPCQ